MVGVGWRTVAVLGLLVAAFACSSDPTISDSVYDRSCAQNTDCATVTDGDVCCCKGGYAAINVTELPRYQTDLVNLVSSCPRRHAVRSRRPWRQPVLADQIMKQHGGRIWFESTERCGSTFHDAFQAGA